MDEALCHKLSCNLSRPASDKFVNFLRHFLRIALSTCNWFLLPRDPFLHPFCSSVSRPFLSKWWYTSSSMIPVKIFHITGRQTKRRYSLACATHAESFCIKTVLPLTIHSVTFPWHLESRKHSCNLECNTDSFVNQNPWTKSKPAAFQFATLLTPALI